jgi:hypothetical protein
VALLAALAPSLPAGAEEEAAATAAAAAATAKGGFDASTLLLLLPIVLYGAFNVYRCACCCPSPSFPPHCFAGTALGAAAGQAQQAAVGSRASCSTAPAARPSIKDGTRTGVRGVCVGVRAVTLSSASAFFGLAHFCLRSTAPSGSQLTRLLPLPLPRSRREKANRKATFSDFAFLLGGVAVLGNILSIVIFKVRWF